MEQKLVFILGEQCVTTERIDSLLNDGWIVKTIAPQQVASGSSSWVYGGFLVLLERE